MADVDFLEQAPTKVNIADDLDQEELDQMAREIIKGVEVDESSRYDWMREHDKWQELATQVSERKNWPWEGASNVKYPLLNISAIQFHSRAYPEIVMDQPVKADVVGRDPDGRKQEAAHRIANHISYQLMHEQDDWQEEMDRLLINLPISGVMFRKVYYNPELRSVSTELINPRNLCVNYYSKNLKYAPRVTHIQRFHKNELVEFINAGIFLDEDLDCGHRTTEIHGSDTPDRIQKMEKPAQDTDTAEEPHTLYECHTWWDLDDDGYKEPYIITVDADIRKTLRVVARYDRSLLRFTEDGDFYKIEPFNHFQNYVFIPDPNSEIYGLGFGHLIGPTNEAVNTIINQLIDAGTLSNMQSGFLSKGIRLRGGNTRFRPGEWKVTYNTGEDLQKGIYPLPVREPSQVLFELLGTLIESGQQTSAVTDIMVGENPGQNQPASTTMSVMEQGQKVFNGIFKRIWRSLSREYEKIQHINAYVGDTSESYQIATNQNRRQYTLDYSESMVFVKPSANPENVTDVQRMVKAEQLWPLVQAGLVNGQEFARRFVEAQGHEDIESLLQQPQPQPDPETELELAKFNHQRQLDWANFQLETVKTQADSQRQEAAAVQSFAQAQATTDRDLMDQYRNVLDTIKTREDVISQRLDRLQRLSQEQRENRRQQAEEAQQGQQIQQGRAELAQEAMESRRGGMGGPQGGQTR